MPNYIATIVSKKKGSTRYKKRRVEIFAESPSDAEKQLLPTLKKGESIYDVGGKMSNAMAFDNINRRRV